MISVFMVVAAAAVPTHAASEAVPPTWARAQAAEAAGDWELALTLSRQCLVEDPGFADARLLEAHALQRNRNHPAAMRAYRTLLDHPVHGEEAAHQLANRDNRWRRDQPALSLGLGLYDDRGPHPRSLHPTLVGELELPVLWRLTVRADLTTNWPEDDALALQGPQVSALAAYHQPLGLWAVDLAAGPSVGFGRSVYWEGAVGGPLPGLRVAGGVSHRPHRNVGWRAEVGWGGLKGVWPALNSWSGGFDTRLLVTGYAW